jgi:hypothetical protein
MKMIEKDQSMMFAMGARGALQDELDEVPDGQAA